jgi:hypothetical protein
MTTFAVLSNDSIVINRIVAETIEDAEALTGYTCVECDGTSHFGQKYENGQFITIENPVIEDSSATE